MQRRHALIGLGLALAAATGDARSADMPPIFEEAPALVREFGSGWYLRGDIAYRMNMRPTATMSDGVAITTSRFEDTFVAGAGVGFKAGWFRIDLTADYGTRTKFSGSSAAVSPYVQASFDTITTFVNGYVDLGTWSHVTPYVGAGVGGAHIRTLSYVTPFGNLTPNERQINFAWAVMAGLGYNLSRNVTIDAGYRYVNLGNTHSGTPLLGPSATFHDLKGHEVRLGVRYQID